MFLLKGWKARKKYSKKNLKTRPSNKEEFTGQVKEKKIFKLSEHFCRPKIQSLKEIQKLQLKLQILPKFHGARVTQLQRPLPEEICYWEIDNELPRVYRTMSYTYQNSAGRGGRRGQRTEKNHFLLSKPDSPLWAKSLWKLNGSSVRLGKAQQAKERKWPRQTNSC